MKCSFIILYFQNWTCNLIQSCFSSKHCIQFSFSMLSYLLAIMAAQGRDNQAQFSGLSRGASLSSAHRKLYSSAGASIGTSPLIPKWYSISGSFAHTTSPAPSVRQYRLPTGPQYLSFTEQSIGFPHNLHRLGYVWTITH